MKRALSAGLLSMVVTFSAMAPYAHAVQAKIHGTRVTIDKPDGFVDAPNFSGVQQDSERAAIMITELPAPYSKCTAGFNESGLSSRGMKLISKEDVTAGDYRGMLMQITQTAAGLDYKKWMMAFGDESKTVIVTASFPLDSEHLSEKMKKAVLSARYDAKAAAPDPLADLPFTISDTKDLKFAQRVQNSLLFTPSGKILTGAPDLSMFIVGQALSDVDVGDKAAYARRRLRQSAGLTNFEILQEADTTISGMPAREILAQAVGKKGEKLFVYQVLAYGLGSYFIMQGITDLVRRELREKQFRALAGSFKLK